MKRSERKLIKIFPKQQKVSWKVLKWVTFVCIRIILSNYYLGQATFQQEIKVSEKKTRIKNFSRGQSVNQMVQKEITSIYIKNNLSNSQKHVIITAWYKLESKALKQQSTAKEWGGRNKSNLALHTPHSIVC